jgi:hypothetical protein
LALTDLPFLQNVARKKNSKRQKEILKENRLKGQRPFSSSLQGGPGNTHVECLVLLKSTWYYK